ncbi:hypothetical protein EMCRGX_G014852 [Ephydatia muelleri]
MIDLLHHSGSAHHIRLNRSFLSDLQWWKAFATTWNGISYLATNASSQFASDILRNLGLRSLVRVIVVPVAMGVLSQNLDIAVMDSINARDSDVSPYSVLSPFPVTEKLLCYFATALANDGLAPQTIKLYLLAVRSMQLSLRLPPPRDKSSLPILKRVLDGIRRDKFLGGKSPRTCLPITVTVLRQLQSPLDTAVGPDSMVYWAIATAVFFGFFWLGASNKVPITKSKFVAKVREAMKAAGYPEDQFASHSFHIGAATTAAIAGIEDSTIQMLGRWHSAAFLRYISTPHDHLAAITASLARSNPQ